jgi:hypothetical protein
MMPVKSSVQGIITRGFVSLMAILTQSIAESRLALAIYGVRGKARWSRSMHLHTRNSRHQTIGRRA